MGHYYFKSSDGTVSGHMQIPNIYLYKGFRFEYHHYLGYTKVNKDFSISKREGKKYYDVIHEFNKLSDEEKEKYLIYS